MSKILLVDDDLELTELFAALLTIEGFQVEIAHNGQQALSMLDDTYQLVLLDVMMPVLNGIETLRQIRQRSNVPVMILSAKGEEIDRIIGLELGADDYLSKPFNDRELLARIRAILRRSQTRESSQVILDRASPFIELFGLKFDVNLQQAFYQEKDLGLTGTEFSLLYKLALHPNVVFSREELSNEILNKPLALFDRSIDMHMSNLRRKLPERADERPWFKTFRGKGYLLVS